MYLGFELSTSAFPRLCPVSLPLPVTIQRLHSLLSLTVVNTMPFRLSLLAGFLQLCHASFDANLSTYINVQVPVTLHELNITGGLIHHQAQFGSHFNFLQQEGEIVAVTHDVHGSLCVMPDANITKEFGQPPFLLIAEMGGCTPVSKAKRAQELGAAGLILSSHECLCAEKDTCPEKDNATPCVPDLENLYDDGTGNIVQIPTMIISRHKAMQIKNALHENQTIVMEMAWHPRKLEKSVTIDLWYSPHHRETEDFLADFASLALLLKDQLTFRSYTYIYDGHHLRCNGNADDAKHSPCYDMCTNNGRYCSYNHHGGTGKDIVAESLRRICLLKHYTMEDFWLYIHRVHDLCGETGTTPHDKKCFDEALKHAHISEHVIQNCTDNSGGTVGNETNNLLDEALKNSTHIIQTPTIHINGLPYRGPLSSRSVFESFCMGFQTGKAPHVCSICAFCGDPVACASRSPMHCTARDDEIPWSPTTPTKRTEKQRKKGRGFGHFILVTFILTGIGGYVYYKKYMENDQRPSYSSYTLGDALMSDGP